mmetsp:Transcript_16795/g.16049  ORF Transcript_16795/g.16049 Transcript_16795/m.16049 type:complete len:92 (+) Transcript_16795:268-543(+)
MLFILLPFGPVVPLVGSLPVIPFSTIFSLPLFPSGMSPAFFLSFIPLNLMLLSFLFLFLFLFIDRQIYVVSNHKPQLLQSFHVIRPSSAHH